MASLYEGYGMVAVEPMVRGVPVIVRDYPSIREAVGDGAAIVPFDAPAATWIETMRAVSDDPAPWRHRATERARELAEREVSEIDALVRFLGES